MDLLQELLADYDGTVLLVSHDRDFLDRLVTSVIAAEGDGRWTEYAGGYSDMLAQRRGRDLARQTPAGEDGRARPGADTASPNAGGAGEATQSVRRKLSFKDKHALAALPKTMAALETEVAALSAKLADADLFRRDPTAFAAATNRLAGAQAELVLAEEQWLQLELLREELEGRP